MRRFLFIRRLTVPILLTSQLLAACTGGNTKSVTLMCLGKQIEVTFALRAGAVRPTEMRFPLENGAHATATFSGDADQPTIIWPMADEVFLGGTRPRKLTHYQGGQIASIPKTSIVFEGGPLCTER